MFTARRSPAARLTAAAATALLAGVGLAGCSLVEVAPPTPLSGIAACSLGNTWNLDTANLAEVLTAELASRGITAVVAVDGSQSLAWDLDSNVVLKTDYTVTSTSGAEGAQTVITSKHSGTSKGIAYINSEVAIPRDWDGTALKVTTTATVSGVDTDPVPYDNVATDIDDSVGVELTCDGSTLTTHQRGSDITLTWAKK